MKNIISNKYFLIGLALVVGLSIGALFNSGGGVDNTEADHEQLHNSNEVWTCSMHPQIKRQEPGDCPICGMDLIPLAQETSDSDMGMSVKMTPTAMQLANVMTATVGTKGQAETLRLNGKVQENEQLLYRQTAHFSGRIESLMVDFKGDYVRKGQVVARLYAPQLQTAQQELLEAKKYEDSQPELLEAAKQKLKNWKLTDAQINGILKNNVPQESFPLLAGYSGYVTALNVNKGDYVEKGKVLYQLADLSQVWVLLDLYESQITSVNKGDQVVVEVNAFPNEKWEGSIDFIDPIINPNTRVASARVVLKNPNQKLKPAMLVSATVEAGAKANDKLSIPKSAILWTGKRSVVYVKESNESGIYFSMREVSLGQSLGDSYVITNGLSAGEEIAVNGAFSIDAAAQLAGKPSMMAHELTQAPVEMNKPAKEAFSKLVSAYISVKDKLVADDFDGALTANEKFLSAMKAVPMKQFSKETHQVWMPIQQKLLSASKSFKQSKDIEESRKVFINFSNNMIKMAKSFQPLDKTLYVQHCPMADSNKGADWLSRESEILNPYFGEAMLSCGEVTEEITQ